MIRWRALLVPAGFAAAVAVLLAAGRSELAPPPLSADAFVAWVERRGTIAAAVAVMRLAALLAVAWLAATTTVATAARAAGSARLAAGAERGMPEPLRRAVSAAAGVGVGVASVVTLGGAAAGADPDQPAPTSEHLVLLPADGEGTATMSVLPDAPPAPAPAPTPPDEWVVAPGDSFWSIAEELVGDALGRAPADAEVDPYWRALIEANRERLVAPDPDLVHPGQVFVLPPRPPAIAQP
jgi:nucleoid-associated protein YgaU